jgi:hypothetical protein
MLFTLIYRGSLKSNGGVKEKHAIRRAFHRQLLQLWQYPPLDSQIDPRERLRDQLGIKPSPNVVRDLGSIKVAPLFSKGMGVVVELDILLLRPEPPGSFVVSGGDIDNRLKTLFDALRAPHNLDELPRPLEVLENESTFLTLLEDDTQIVRAIVETDVLLESTSGQTEVQLFIRVKTRLTKVTYENIGLG